MVRESLRITPDESDPNLYPPPSADDLAGEEGTKLFGVRIPFPFSAIVNLLFLLMLFIAAGLSIPVGLVRPIIERRREAQFAQKMKTAGRMIPWSEVASEMEAGNGTVICEWLSMKDPVRVWWTRDNIASISPHACSLDKYPDFFDPELVDFFRWCGERYTDPQVGSATLIVIPKEFQDSALAKMDDLRSATRYVSIRSPRA